MLFAEQIHAYELPAEFVRDIEGWRSRSGVVKINAAMDRLPVFTSKPDQADLSGGVELAHSIPYLERAFEQARAGDELEAYADRVIDGYDELAPGFRDSITHRQVIGPYEMEREWGLVGGNIFHGELSADQLFHMRPAAGYADYRSPIDGLYQASSATHGGGGVCGIPGYNAYRAIQRDRRRRARARR